MTDQLRYIGPLPGQTDGKKSGWAAVRQRVSLPFVVVVGVPTLLALIYWGLVATPQYVSEAHFMVRKTQESRPNSLGLVLQGVGLSAGVSDSFAVQEFIGSRDAAEALDKRLDLAKVLSRNGADALSRYPRPFQRASEEAQYKALKRFVTVSYNATSGITTLRTQAFAPQDAQSMNLALIAEGEKLVNRLNERSASDAVAEAEQAVIDATARHADIQRQLATFRNRERFIDPQIAAAESTQLIAGLLSSAAQLRAEYAQLQQTAPQSPQLPVIQSRIAAYDAQIAQERTKLTGDASSLVPKIATYENLVFQGELATRALAESSSALLTAQQDARRQKLYLDRIVEPNLADRPTQPQRLRAIIIVFLSSLMVFLLGRLLWAGLREHRQE
ncbi:chain-length determining protein [Brevundimonas nasdae]|uniref:chain-length determining protein n=1 Tax=Brevundimonas nasdae TaxID=172043 RepID=UPI003F68E8A5